MRLLLAEDDPRLLKSLTHIFEANRFVTDGVSNGEDALSYALSREYDGLVLDIMMPGLDEIEVLKRLRREGVLSPVLFLTARSEVYQRVEGLDAGAYAYLPKPYSTSELLARVLAMLRRKCSYLPDLLSYGGVVLNRSTYEIEYNGEIQALRGKEFQIAEMFMQQPHRIITTEQFITHIWGWDTNVDTSVVWVHISNLRKKLDALKAPLRIRFIRNAGYLLEDRTDDL